MRKLRDLRKRFSNLQPTFHPQPQPDEQEPLEIGFLRDMLLANPTPARKRLLAERLSYYKEKPC